MNVENISHGYFEYQNQNYFIAKIDTRFLQVYSQYDFLIHSLNVRGFEIVKNCFHQIISQDHVLLTFEYETFDIYQYLTYSLKVIPVGYLSIQEIKESWIHKIDLVREEISKYAYSFQFDRDLNALMHYYCGLGENGICILNEILTIQKNAQLSLSLSLKQPVHSYYYELLNPCHYTISTKAKHILNLLKSHIIDLKFLNQLIEGSYFQIYELLYLYARMFYSSDFFHCVLTQQMSDENIRFFLNNYQIELRQIQEMKKLISKYISLPEISWIDEENMI